MAEPTNGTCFVIAPIGGAETEIRKRSDQILKYLIAPASQECGYGDPVRADTLAGAGMITTQIIQHLIDDAIVIADLTGQNPNVFYELAIRHAFRKPVIQLGQSGQEIPFDVSGLRTVTVDHKDLDSVAQAKAQLIQHMKAFQEHPDDVESPVSIAVDREVLRRGSVQERELGQVLDGLAELRSLLLKSITYQQAKVVVVDADTPVHVGAYRSALSELASLGGLPQINTTIRAPRVKDLAHGAIGGLGAPPQQED